MKPASSRRDTVGDVIADLVQAGVDPKLIGRVAEMMIARASAAAAGSSFGSSVSPGAIRTRRYRARKALEAASHGDVTVTHETPATRPTAPPLRAVNPAETGAFVQDGPAPQRVLPLMSPVTSVTNVTERDASGQKEIPPHPPKKKHNLPQKGVSASHRASPQLHRPNWRSADDPVFKAAETIRGHSLPRDKRNGWEISTELISRAEALISERGPPRIADTG